MKISKAKNVAKVGGAVRDLLMKQAATVVLGKQIHYYGEVYDFDPYTREELRNLYQKTLDSVKKILYPRG